MGELPITVFAITRNGIKEGYTPPPGHSTVNIIGVYQSGDIQDTPLFLGEIITPSGTKDPSGSPAIYINPPELADKLINYKQNGVPIEITISQALQGF
ncbi:hypothetical protein A2767_01200 [Candidatus Roizmanbacteria bacterium RIFCSPHIGHO2_01_FULL_35_10]|uniref:Uncharacterized protein n=1 Tax=Candidatus Roizmanbacteria bacterium RIFCSPLOWO2_01_FULL_35_13 TaxID=1802055 RepID=A0A1F7IC06_9BACT|nr:MAG: hypothetical protein A2767_01200 [Candidatus Roizmanbacteria bacterium RIFCSPHIGHO2_01_FULL_35_10]OGK40898.1 MAG: hypothetical protein A3A74_01570 [Candidatus Roizmanbacteria bacterium RIFCSPLOWO2_01_FULL_35_13]